MFSNQTEIILSKRALLFVKNTKMIHLYNIEPVACVVSLNYLVVYTETIKNTPYLHVLFPKGRHFNVYIASPKIFAGHFKLLPGHKTFFFWGGGQRGEKKCRIFV